VPGRAQRRDSRGWRGAAVSAHTPTPLKANSDSVIFCGSIAVARVIAGEDRAKIAADWCASLNSHAALVAELATRDREFQAMFKEAVAYKERCAALVAALEDLYASRNLPDSDRREVLARADAALKAAKGEA
jgi:hypothetical protein